MSSFPRRSARLSPHLTQDQSQARHLTSNSVPSFAQFSQPSSTSTTSHPSPTNDAGNPPPPPPTPHQLQPRLQVQSQFMPQQSSHLNPPLPSPSAADLDPFFGRPHSQPNPYSANQSGLMPQQSQQQGGFSQQNQEQPQQHHPHTNSMSHDQNIHGMNPGQLPPDFLAEAAKRAQMACLMRDLGDVSL